MQNNLPPMENMVPVTKTGTLQSFAPLPKHILGHGLSHAAILVYSLLLDRSNLSRRNDWCDRNGWLYVSYTIPHLAEVVERGEATVRRVLKELEDRGLIFRTHPFAGEASWIFLYAPRDDPGSE